MDPECIFDLPNHVGIKTNDVLLEPCTDHDIVKVNMFNYGKGGEESMLQELSSSYFGAMPMTVEEPEFIEETLSQIKEFYAPNVIKSVPRSWEDVVAEKDKKTSVGFPLVSMFSDCGNFLEAYEGDMEQLYADLDEAEKLVLQGQAPISYWKVLPKEDKYTEKKVKSRRFRLVSIGSFFLLCLCRRWLGTVDSHIKHIVAQFHLLGQGDPYERHVLKRLAGRYSVGVDYTAFDKNSSREFTMASFDFMDYMSGRATPRRIIEYITLNVCNPFTIISNKATGRTTYFHLSATNPSGQLHTTNVNSLTHLFHNAIIMRKKFLVSVEDYLGDVSFVRSVMTGDDGLETCEDPDTTMVVVREMAYSVGQLFGIPAKIESLYDEEQKSEVPFPPDVMAPFLSEMCVVRPEDDQYYLIPSHPKRMIAKLIYVPEDKLGNIRELLHSRCVNIADRMHGLAVHQLLNPDLPPNMILRLMKDYMKEFGVLMKNEHDFTGVVKRITTGQIRITQ